MRQLSREFKMSRTTVASLLVQRGIDTSRGMKPEDAQRAVELYEEGHSSISIGRMLGFDNHTILTELRHHGVAIRNAATG